MGTKLRKVPVAALRFDNIRSGAEQADIEALAASFHDDKEPEQPPVVTANNGDDKGTYMVLFGERRVRAAQSLGQETMTVLVRPAISREDRLTSQLVENIQRKSLNPLDEAAAIAELVLSYEYSQKDIAAMLGKSEPWVSQRLSLLERLSPDVKAALADDAITLSVAEEMMRLEPQQQADVLPNVQNATLRQAAQIVDQTIVDKRLRTNGSNAKVKPETLDKYGRLVAGGADPMLVLALSELDEATITVLGVVDGYKLAEAKGDVRLGIQVSAERLKERAEQIIALVKEA